MDDIQATIKSLVIESNPWTEKYRPTIFKDIVLDPINRELFDNIIKNDIMPHLLLYGPPGSGKTTSSIQLIRAHQSKYNRINNSNVIHLNASDERGIDIIRSQIQQFVQSSNMFEPGKKFVILDEVDYITKNAQHALKNLIQSCVPNVKFCLICNYISKIEESLKDEFMCIRFNQLPPADIHSFLTHIVVQEKMALTSPQITAIQEIYNSDIRSMVNFLQLHQTANADLPLMTNELWIDLFAIMKTDPKKIEEWIYIKKCEYNLDIYSFFKYFFNYIIENMPNCVTPDFLMFVDDLIHIDREINHKIMVRYFIHGFIRLFPVPNPKKRKKQNSVNVKTNIYVLNNAESDGEYY